MSHLVNLEAYFKKNVSFHVDEKGNPIYGDTYVYAAFHYVCLEVKVKSMVYAGYLLIGRNINGNCWGW